MPDVNLPELGEGITKATIACWHCREGDVIKKGDDVVELVTDKASFSVSAVCDGAVEKIFFQEGQEAKIGDALIRINP